MAEMKRKPMTNLEKRKRNGKSPLWRKKAFELFMSQYRGLPCAVCGTTDSTVGHHILEKRYCPRHVFTSQNIVVLCPSHHKWSRDLAAHSMNGLAIDRFFRWLEKAIPWQYAWVLQHEHDKFEKDPDFREIYETVKGFMA
jgi:hypothetical protein